MKHAVLYLRVSSAGQTRRAGSEEGYSIEAQREACARKAAQLEAEVIEEYVDAAESARTAQRPQLRAMLARLARQRDVDFVIVHKLDRLARSRADDVEIVAAIRAAGAQPISVTENIDETPTGLLLHGIMASVAEFYSQNLGTEILKGLTQKAKNGETPTRAPLGYVNVRKLVEGREIRTVEIDPERSPIVKWAFGAYATGEYSLDGLLQEVTARGLTSRPSATRQAKPLSRSVLARMLHNPYYVGTVSYGGATYRGNHPTFIPQAVFDRVQEVFVSHDVAGERQRKHPHYLKGTVYCGRCGRRLLYQRAVGRRGGVYWYFMCAGRHNGNSGCPQPYLPAEVVEAAVARHYGQTIKFKAERLLALEKKLRTAFRGIAEHVGEEAERQRRRISQLQERQRKLVDVHLAGAIPVEVLREKQEQASRELRKAEERLSAATIELSKGEKAVTHALELAADAARAYEAAPPQTRRLWNQAFFQKIYLWNDDVSGSDLTDAYAALLAEELVKDLENLQTPASAFGGRGSIERRLVEPAGIEPATF